MMDNPWAELPAKPPYVLPGDRESLTTLNNRASAGGRADCRINEASIPEPFIGSTKSATVILLNLNPGDSDDDRKAHENPAFRDAMIRNLRHEEQEYPFYPLNPAFAWTACAKWWTQHLHELFDRGKLSPEAVAQRLCVIEWFPYHSPKAKCLPDTRICPSQEYSFGLAKRILGTNRLIIGMRARRRWAKVEPLLGKVGYLRSAQNPAISVGNVGDSLFWRIVTALRNGNLR